MTRGVILNYICTHKPGPPFVREPVISIYSIVMTLVHLIAFFFSLKRDWRLIQNKPCFVFNLIIARGTKPPTAIWTKMISILIAVGSGKARFTLKDVNWARWFCHKRKPHIKTTPGLIFDGNCWERRPSSVLRLILKLPSVINKKSDTYKT